MADLSPDDDVPGVDPAPSPGESRRHDFSDAPSRAPDVARAWAVAGAMSLAIGALLPVRRFPAEFLTSEMEGKAQWVWMLAEVDRLQVVPQALQLMLAPVAGIAAFVLALTLGGRSRAIAMTAIGSAFLLIAPFTWMDDLVAPYGFTSIPIVFDMIRELALVGVVIGVVVARSSPSLRRGPLLGAISASIVLLSILVPSGDESLFNGLFESAVWETKWGANIVMLLHLGLCGFMLAGFKPEVVAENDEEDPFPHRAGRGQGFRRWGAVLAAVTVALTPILARVPTAPEFGYLFTYSHMLQWTLVDYGAYVVLGAGVVELLTRGIRTGSADRPEPMTDMQSVPTVPLAPPLAATVGLPAAFGRTWAIVAGSALIAAFLLPLGINDRIEPVRTLWSWSSLASATILMTLDVVLWPVAGIVTVVLASTLVARRRFVACLVISGCLIIRSLVRVLEASAESRYQQLPFVLIPIGIALAATFVGTTLVRIAPDRRIGFNIAAIAASVAIFLLLVPLTTVMGVPFIGALFSPRAWEEAWQFNLAVLYVFAYCGFCVSGYGRWTAPKEFGWAGLPLGIALFLIPAISMLLVGYGALSTVSVFLSLSAMLVLTGIGATGLILSPSRKTPKQVPLDAVAEPEPAEEPERVNRRGAAILGSRSFLMSVLAASVVVAWALWYRDHHSTRGIPIESSDLWESESRCPLVTDDFFPFGFSEPLPAMTIESQLKGEPGSGHAVFSGSGFPTKSMQDGRTVWSARKWVELFLERDLDFRCREKGGVQMDDEQTVVTGDFRFESTSESKHEFRIVFGKAGIMSLTVDGQRRW